MTNKQKEDAKKFKNEITSTSKDIAYLAIASGWQPKKIDGNAVVFVNSKQSKNSKFLILPTDLKEDAISLSKILPMVVAPAMKNFSLEQQEVVQTALVMGEVSDAEKIIYGAKEKDKKFVQWAKDVKASWEEGVKKFERKTPTSKLEEPGLTA